MYTYLSLPFKFITEPVIEMFYGVGKSFMFRGKKMTRLQGTSLCPRSMLLLSVSTLILLAN